ncbi:MAG: serine hydrolase [Luteolibacter sp.]|uniref:serine hydrolase n=1 Tax=Luteolibacter sp. TaxID=1962973 RepID=UPI003264445F
MPGCSIPFTPAGEINIDAVARLGGDGYGIWQRGHFIAGRNLGGRMPSFSITKSLAALAVVEAAGQGWINLDRSLIDILPEWRSDAGKRRITVRMLVNQTAGFPSGVEALYRGSIPDKGRVARSLPLVNPPGEQFRYGPASSEILAEVLRRVLRERGSTTESFLREIMGRIGISSPNWRKDGMGKFYLSTGAEFSVQDLGRLGQVVAKLANGSNAVDLNGGVFRDLASPHAANPMVAAGFWWNRNAAKTGAFAIEPELHLDAVSPPSFWQHACLATSVDPGWLAMVGSGGKRVYVLPSRDWVIVRLGRSASWDDAAFLRAAVSA